MNAYPQSQRGMVLVVTLVLMLILTIVASSGMEIVTLQERIAGNTRDNITAFQAAEGAVRQAEDVLEGANLGTFTGANGLYEICANNDNRAACASPDWDDRASNGWATVPDNVAHVNQQPEYIIEKYTTVANPQAALDADTPLDTYEFYRVTARGYGISSNSLVVLQTSYRRN